MSDPEPGDTIATPRADSSGLSTAMRKVSEKEHAEAAVKQALDTRMDPVFNTHSHTVDAMFAAQEIALKALVGDIDAKIEQLQAERTDAMLAYSMLSAGRLAREKGVSG
jgi:hypothetical protein